MVFRYQIAMLLAIVTLLGCSSDAGPGDGATIEGNEAPAVDASESSSDKPDPDFAVIAGTWETIRLVSAGEETPRERMRKDLTVTFEGDKMITKLRGEVKSTWPITLDSSKSPKQMTINTADPGAKERLSHLIYKIEGDTLTTCSGGRKFPTEFTENTVKGCFLTVRKRIEP